MDRLLSMKIFSRVVSEGSFASAARKLDLSPAMVTRLVADLEDHLGTRLLNRTTRRLALTSAGVQYVDRVRQILADVDEAEAVATAGTDEPRGHLRISMPAAFATHQLAKHLPAFRKAYPAVTLDILTVAGRADVVDEDCDVTILTTLEGTLDGMFVARRLASSQIIGCASPQYLESRGRPSHPSELSKLDILLPPGLREIVFQPCDANLDWTDSRNVVVGIPEDYALTSQNSEMVYAMTLAGLGIGGMPSYVVEDALRAGTLERVLPAWRLHSLAVHAAIPTRKHLPTRTRAFIEFLVQVCGGTEQDPWIASGAPAGLSAPTVVRTA